MCYPGVRRKSGRRGGREDLFGRRRELRERSNESHTDLVEKGPQRQILTKEVMGVWGEGHFRRGKKFTVEKEVD